MQRAERIALYTVSAAALVLSIRAASPDSRAVAAPAAAPASLVESPVRIATCDTIAATDALFASETYAQPRKAEEDRLKTRLTPLETELDALQKELQTADPNKPENQAKAQTFQSKRDDYFKLRKELSESYDKFVSTQFGEAYERVQAAARAVAQENNYTHVLSHKASRISAKDPQSLIADLLGRPALVAPEGTDVTDKVIAQLKLPAKPAEQPSASPAK